MCLSCNFVNVYMKLVNVTRIWLTIIKMQMVLGSQLAISAAFFNFLHKTDDYW